MYITDGQYRCIKNILTCTIEDNELSMFEIGGLDLETRKILLSELEHQYNETIDNINAEFAKSMRIEWLNNDKIKAIKATRIVTGCGLKEGKDFIDFVASACNEKEKQLVVEYINELNAESLIYFGKVNGLFKNL